MERLPDKIRELRKSTGWTQEELAQQIGVTLSTVQRWESKGGKPSRLARKALEKIFRKHDII